MECLKTDGWLFLSSINKTVESYLTMIIAAEKVLGLIPQGTHEYNKFIDFKEV